MMEKARIKSIKTTLRALGASSWITGCAKAVPFVVAMYAASPAFAEPAISPKSGTLGFVVWKWNFGNYQSKFWDECPDGAEISQDEIWWKGLSKADRSRITNNGNIDANTRLHTANQRGPNGEDVCWRPELFKDPPLREARGPISYGFNLDGTTDGKATAATCAHEKFEKSPQGGKAIDNQMFRILGCHVGWRNFAIVDAYSNAGRLDSSAGLVLIEVTGVEDARNDNDVTVSFYAASDQFRLQRDNTGKVLPYASFMIENINGVPRYSGTARGKIVDGVLMTEPANITMQYFIRNATHGEISFQNMKLRLEISEDGSSAKGVVGGYRDISKVYDEIRDAEGNASHADFNCPSIYEALHRLADGSPDPKTGKCTAISTAHRIVASAAFIVHPEDHKKTAQTEIPVQTANP
jgi:hypothetical protein